MSNFVINSLSKLQAEKDLLDSLVNVEKAVSIMNKTKAAKDIPMEHYSQLNCDIQVLNKTVRYYYIIILV
jgi:hypothetical protein